MRTRLYVTAAALLVCVALASPAEAGRRQARSRAIENAADKTAGELDAEPRFEGVKNIAVAPIFDDDEGELAEALKSASTKSRYTVIVRTDDEWRRLLDEIKWDDQRQDVMDPATIQKFGRIQGVDAILYGRLKGVSYYLWNIFCVVEADLKLADVETGKLLWGDTVVGVGLDVGAIVVVIIILVVILFLIALVIGVFRRLIKPY